MWRPPTQLVTALKAVWCVVCVCVFQEGAVYVAMYEYDAQDSDEVSFVEGDKIIHEETVDDGWMYGRVERTGAEGMLPANYVQLLTDK